MLLYGHLDKQPEMVGWSEGLGPWTPVRRGDRLYGRGGADDGYAAFAAAHRGGGAAGAGSSARPVRHPRRDLRGERERRPARLHGLARGAHRARRASWCASTRPAATTTSSGPRRRSEGWSAASSSVEILGEGIHSGASGIVPVELPDPAPAPVAPRGRADGGDPTARPPRRDPARARVQQAQEVAATLGDLGSRMPFVPGMRAAPARSDRAGPRSHLAARARDHGRRRAPVHRRRGNVLRPRTAVSSRSACRRPSTRRPPRAG